MTCNHTEISETTIPSKYGLSTIFRCNGCKILGSWEKFKGTVLKLHSLNGETHVRNNVDDKFTKLGG